MRAASQISDLAGTDVYTMPPKVAKEFMASAPNPANLKTQFDRDFPVSFNAGVDKQAIDVLWSVDDAFKSMCEDVKRRDPLRLTGNDLRHADADHRTCLFHEFSRSETLEIREHGKIPDWNHWKGVSDLKLDTLMTQSALQSFVVDQAALDDHLLEIAHKS